MACFLQLHEIDLHLFTTTEFYANQIFKESKHTHTDTPEFDLLDFTEYAAFCSLLVCVLALLEDLIVSMKTHENKQQLNVLPK